MVLSLTEMEMCYNRNASCFDKTHLSLTICPTLACNFACTYCFEKSQRDYTMMDDNTINGILSFIKKHEESKHLSVSWFGGEPTLAFSIVEKLTEKFIEIFPNYNNAGLITNGYNLDKSKIEVLNDLRISSIQVTLDGKDVTHNQRRMLRSGEGTFHKILDNIDLLLNSSWEGFCSIRINIDRTNMHEYSLLFKMLQDRYKNKNLSIYPGHVDAFEAHTQHHKNCSLCNSEWIDFLLDIYNKDWTIPFSSFYPQSAIQNTCIATIIHGYVIGPNGELYKCWEDVGNNKMIIGSVHDESLITNPELLYRYTIGANPFNDNECMKCKTFPICGGGCVNKRMRKLQFGDYDIEYCSPLKESLGKYLEAYIDTWNTKAICSAILGKENVLSMDKGYRMIQPESRRHV
jgi:uncharacterized protein